MSTFYPLREEGYLFYDPFKIYIYRLKTFKEAIEIDLPANRRRAEGRLHVLETAFTVQRALCTFTGKGQHGQSMVPIRLNRKMMKKTHKVGLDPAWQDLVHAHQS